MSDLNSNNLGVYSIESEDCTPWTDCNLPDPIRLTTTQLITGQKNFASPPRITTAQIDQYGVVNVDMAGADATGATSSAVAFQVCLDAIDTFDRATTLRIPGQTYLIDANLSLDSPRNVQIDGGGTTIRQACNTLLSLLGPQDRRVTIRDINIRMEYTNGRAFNLNNITGLALSNLNGRVSSSSNYWDTFLDLTSVLNIDAQGGHVVNIDLSAPISASLLRGNLLRFGGQCLDGGFTGLIGQGFSKFAYGFASAVPGIEGLFFSLCRAIGVRTGVSFENTAYQAPGLQWIGGHIDAFEQCFVSKGMNQVRISSTLMYRNTLLSMPGQHIVFDGCSQSSVDNSDLDYVNGGGMGGAPSIQFIGGQANRAVGNRGNLPSDCSIAIYSSSSKTDAIYNTFAGAGLSGDGTFITGASSSNPGNRII